MVNSGFIKNGVLRSYAALVYASYITGLTRTLLWRRSNQRRCTILLYHEVDTAKSNGFGSGGDTRVPPEVFRRQVQFLKKHFHPLSLRDAVSHLSSGTPFPPGSLVVSFDDGYKSNLSNAYPVLEQYSVPFTVFVTTDYMSGKSIPWWDSVNQAIADTTATVTLDLDSLQGSFELESRSEKRRLYAHVRRLMLTYPQWEREITSHLKERVPGWRGETEQDAFLSKEDLRRMAQNSLVEIGSHSRSHASLPRLEEEALLREVRDSRSTLEEELGRPVESFAYPYGEPADVSALVARVVQDCGYRCALTGVPGTVNLGDDAFQLRRVSVDGRDDWPKFTGKLAGVSQFLRSAGKAVFRGNDR